MPASVLVEVLTGAQRAIHLLGMVSEGVEINERARIPAQIEAKYALNCEAPESGSYVLPARVGYGGDLLADGSGAVNVVKDFFEIGSAVLAKDIERLRQIVPDKMMRSRVLEAFRVMVPKPGSGLKLELNRKSQGALHFDEQLQPVLKGLLKRAEAIQEVRTITGKLEKVHFLERKLTLIYPVTERELDCFYDEAIEESLLAQRRGLIQVTGQVVLDEDNHPKKIVEVESISGVDLSPFQVVEVAYGSGKLQFNHPESLVPTLSGDLQLLCLEKPELALDIHAETRDQLAIELQEQVVMLWEEYARADDTDLSQPAKELKRRLLAALKEVPDAKG